MTGLGSKKTGLRYVSYGGRDLAHRSQNEGIIRAVPGGPGGDRGAQISRPSRWLMVTIRKDKSQGYEPVSSRVDDDDDDDVTGVMMTSPR